MRIKDTTYSTDEFSDLLQEAEEKATTDVEMKFVDDLTNKVKQYGGEAFITNDQLSWLERIAGVV